jgi:hypothetical protein
MSRDVPWCHCKVEQEVLDSDRVQTVVQQLATSGSSLNDDNQKRKLCIEQQRAVKILKTMASSISGLVVRLTGLVLFKVFGSATSGIRVHQGQMEMVKQAAKRAIPIVYLPIHKSHFDYHMLTYTVFCHDLKTPHVAAGDNLSTWGLRCAMCLSVCLSLNKCLFYVCLSIYLSFFFCSLSFYCHLSCHHLLLFILANYYAVLVGFSSNGSWKMKQDKKIHCIMQSYKNTSLVY